MNVYIYNADIYCEDCAANIRHDLRVQAVGDTGDSGDWPQGPYPDGGGEADYPHHCGACGVFLENPLTQDGYDYVQETLADNPSEIAQMWADYYDID